MKKNIAILWSGGLDSTYLLYNALKEGNTVTAFYINIMNNKNKTKMEKNAINNLKIELEKLNLKNFRVVFPFSINVENVNESLEFQQVPIWIFALTQILNGGLSHKSYNFDEIQIGYVSNDDALSIIDEISKVYNSLVKLFSNSSIKKAKLTFPLKRIKKDRIIQELPESLLYEVVWCESPTIYPSGLFRTCENCSPCKTYKEKTLFRNRAVLVRINEGALKAKEIIEEEPECDNKEKKEEQYCENES
jgi:7-cyano-7-deazaguanine synthase in queuosine biosynthesis